MTQYKGALFSMMLGAAMTFQVACGGGDSGGGGSGGAQPSAGACFDADTSDYSRRGPYAWSTQRIGGFDVYVPRDTPGGCNTFPIVGWAMGTGLPPGYYSEYYGHFASWGLITVVDPSNLLNLTGTSLAGAIQTVMNNSAFRDKVSGVGTIGHSQGGAAAVNVAIGNSLDVGAVVGLAPALFQGSGSLDAAGLYIGGTADLFSVATAPDLPYGKSSGPAFIANLSGVGHNGVATSDTSRNMSTAWFRCHLGGDDNACSLFRQSAGNSCAFPGRFAECRGKNL